MKLLENADDKIQIANQLYDLVINISKIRNLYDFSFTQNVFIMFEDRKVHQKVGSRVAKIQARTGSRSRGHHIQTGASNQLENESARTRVQQRQQLAVQLDSVGHQFQLESTQRRVRLHSVHAEQHQHTQRFSHDDDEQPKCQQSCR